MLVYVCGPGNVPGNELLKSVKKKEYDPFPADIWSCGIVLFVMLSAEAGLRLLPV